MKKLSRKSKKIIKSIIKKELINNEEYYNLMKKENKKLKHLINDIYLFSLALIG